VSSAPETPDRTNDNARAATTEASITPAAANDNTPLPDLQATGTDATGSVAGFSRRAASTIRELPRTQCACSTPPKYVSFHPHRVNYFLAAK